MILQVSFEIITMWPFNTGLSAIGLRRGKMLHGIALASNVRHTFRDKTETKARVRLVSVGKATRSEAKQYDRR